MPNIGISAVIPVFNRANLIDATLQSLLSQTHLPDEVIVVDDCSTDGTWLQLQRMASACPLLRPVRIPENRGAQHARNVGIKNARFPWIAFNDSDDLWIKEKLAIQVRELIRWGTDPWVVIHSDMYIQEGKSAALRHVRLPSFEEPGAFKKILRGYGALFQTMLVSKEALEKVGCLDEAIPAYQEWETTIKLASVCRFIHIPEPLFIWNRHEGETISGDRRRGWAGYRSILEKHGDAMISVGGERLYLRHIFLGAFQQASEGDLGAAHDWLKGSKISALSVRLLLFLMRHGTPKGLVRFLLRCASRWQKLKTLILDNERGR